MKYKVIKGYHAATHGVNSAYFDKGSTIESKDLGQYIFIPFTDQRFFEPIKTRTFQVEVPEDQVGNFDYVNSDQEWTVTEITEPTLPFWVIDFLSQDPDCSIKSFEGIDPVWVKNNFIGRKLEALKWVKAHTNCGLLSAKRLTDYIWETF